MNDAPPSYGANTALAGAQLLDSYASFFFHHGPIMQMYSNGSSCSWDPMTSYDQVMRRAGGYNISNCGNLDAAFADRVNNLTDHGGTEYQLHYHPIAPNVRVIFGQRWVPWGDGFRVRGILDILGLYTPRIIHGVPERAVVTYQRYSHNCVGCTH